MKYDFDTLCPRKGTNCVKWNGDAIESICGNRDAIPMWVADMDFLPQCDIKRKMEEVAALGAYGYPSFPRLRDSFVSWVEKRHSWKVEKDSVVWTMGMLHGISLAVNLFSSEGDHILVPVPAYRPFRAIGERNGRILEEYPLRYENGSYSLDRELFREKASRCSVILFCSPHNPSGLVFSSADLAFVLGEAGKNGAVVLSDEIHADLVHDGEEHIPMGKAAEKTGVECVTFMAPSKTFNIAGDHSAFAVFSHSAMKERFAAFQEALWTAEPGYMIGELTETAYEKGYEWNRELCTYLTGNARAMREYLGKELPEITMVNGNASFVTFLDCSSIYEQVKAKTEREKERYASSSGGPLSRFFGVEAGTAFNDGAWFGEEYSSFIRFNYGAPRSMVMAALERMKNAIDILRRE